MKAAPDLSVILVSYNTKAVTLACLESIFKHSRGFNFEIIVVDNASSDGSPAALKQFKKTHSLRLLLLKKNLGFGRGNNRGAKLARGEYLLLLNTDTLLHDNALKTALDEARAIANLGAYSCRLVNRDGSTQPTGGYFPTLGRILTWQLFLDKLPALNHWWKPIHPGKSWYQQRREFDWLTGAFMLIPRQVFARVGGFDKNIFMYVEDTDLCYRLKQLGLKVVYSPTAKITHLGGASGASGSSLVWEARQTLFFVKKHYGLLAAIVADGLIRLGSLLRYLLFGIINKDATRSFAYRQIILGKLP